MNERIAVATTDGKSVNSHFGKTPFFFVYEIRDGEVTLVDKRDVVAVKQQRFVHDSNTMDKILTLLQDCNAIVAERVGEGVAAVLIQKEKRVYEAQGSVEAVLKQLSQTEKESEAEANGTG